ncbi:MAG: tetratricopeptide repeat protein [Chitinophagaceae bacterium]|nr:tetratricopeptide repeat protein [Chitinophagaceae bacterium]
MTSCKLFLLFFLATSYASCKGRQENVRDLIDKGVDLVNEGEFEAGIALYSKAIRQNSRIQLAYYNRGIAYTELKEYAKAIADFDRLLLLKTGGVRIIGNDLKPSAEGEGQVSYGNVFYQRAVAESYRDSLQRSFNDFQRAIKNRYPDSSNCFLWQGILLGRAGKQKGACEYFEKAKQAAQTVDQQKEAVDMISKHCVEETKKR